ncbi:hypothetical protein [Caproiciproducens faecalis]|uniref:Uncharacterized protein n=1 Tax=Caproiciproducens faecalis TaxID=2820301 RepID=A0ABS7DME2_9FIRM|nr:hypothetical protein [Caproiciproducens faecalis]MBW7572457.1 hypothetical protein [Caproiciproducens faecalis]
MKKRADNPSVTINIFSGNKISLDGKSMVYILVVLVFLTLVISICDPELRADLIRSLIGMASAH